MLVNPANLSKKMKVGDSVYLVTDQLKTGAGIPAMICGMQDSTVELWYYSLDWLHNPESLAKPGRGFCLRRN